MSLLSFYFKIRENAFINTATDETNFLETAAYFILTPSHYVFGGRTFTHIELKNGAYDAVIQQRFDYNSNDFMFILKMISSILVLPFSLILGSFLRQLAIWTDSKAKERYAAMVAIATSTVNRPISYQESLGVTDVFNETILSCEKTLRGPLAMPEIQKQEIDAFKEISKCLKESGIAYWADCGTALGLYRYDGSEDEPMIPWDHDIDMGILRQDHENVKRTLRKHLDKEKYSLEDWSSYSKPESLLRVRLKKTNTVIDLFHFDVNEEKTHLIYNFSHEHTYIPQKWKKREFDMVKPHPIEDVFPLKSMQYGKDSLIEVPGNFKNYLQRLYGENLSPVRVWDEDTKSYIAVKDHPYNIQYGEVEEILTRQPESSV